jgi:F-type H+-transporting ATPase subunit a
MASFGKLVRRLIIIAIIVFLCAFLPRLVPAVLPPILVEAEPVACIGGDLAHHCEGGFPITNSMVATLIVDAVLILLFLAATRRIKLVPSGIQNFMEAIVDLLYGQARQVAGKNAAKVFPIGATVFLFVLFANYMELLPGIDTIGFLHHPEDEAIQAYELDPSTPAGSFVAFLNPRCPIITEAEFDAMSAEEKQARVEAGCKEAPLHESGEGEAAGEHAENPGWAVVPTIRTATTDLNTTLGITIVVVIAIQIYGIRNHMPHDRTGVAAALTGTRRYFGKFFNVGGLRKEGPAKIFGAIDLFASIIEGFSEIIKLVSFSFRLFGNIFAGTVLIFVIMSLVPYVGPVATLLLETFVGAIQAYVFMMLTFVFMNVAAQVHGEGGH